MRRVFVLTCAALLLAASPAFSQINTTVCKVQDGTYAVGTHVLLDSLVVTGLDLKPSTFGFWAQEPSPCGGYPNREYSGILVYMGYANPDTVGGVGLESGDLVTVRGNYTEYPSGGVPSVSEITNPDDAYAPVVQLLQEDYGMPPAVPSTVHNFGTVAEDSANCERWEGVWCRVDTVVCTEWLLPLEYAEWHVVELEDYTGFAKGSRTTDSLRVDDKLVDPSLAKPNPGDSLATVSGIFSYEYGNYKIWPRNNDDVTYISAPPAPNLLQAYSKNGMQVIAVFDRTVSVETAADPFNFEFIYVDVANSMRNPANPAEVLITHTLPTPGTLEQLTVCDVENEFGRPMPECQTAGFRMGVVSVKFVQTPASGDTSQVYNEQVTVGGIVTGGSDTFGGFYVGDPAGGPYSGVYVFASDPAHNRDVGDSVIISASVNEYYGLTELDLPEYVSSPIFTMTPPTDPDVVDVSVLTTPSPNDTAEVWEGCLVKLVDVEVATWPNEFGEWDVHRGVDTCHVGDTGDYTVIYAAGDTINVTGLVDYAFNIWTMQPRDDDDFEGGAGSVAEESPLRVAEFRNYPNPFNPKTVIEFGIASPANVKLTIFDVNGRAVRTLLDGTQMAAGTWRVVWSGNDSNGQTAAAGVYYCRFEAGERVETRKLVMVK